MRPSLPTDTMERRGNALSMALAQGYVVVSPAARGRNSDGADGVSKGTAGLVDLKAAVRYLRHNDKEMSGMAERIVSEGQSAGGAMSSLLSLSGNNEYFEEALKEIGAADARDDVYACIAFCPITDMENANIPYEWMFQTAEPKITGGMGFPENYELTEDDLKLHEAMVKRFDDLMKEKDYTGKGWTSEEYKAYLEEELVKAAQTALDRYAEDGVDYGVADITEENGFTVADGKVTGADLFKWTAMTLRSTRTRILWLT